MVREAFEVEIRRGRLQGERGAGWLRYRAAAATGEGAETLTPRRGGVEVEVRILGFVFDETDDAGRGMIGPTLELRDGAVTALRYRVAFRSTQARNLGAAGMSLADFERGPDGVLRAEVRLWAPPPGDAHGPVQIPIRASPPPAQPAAGPPSL